LISVGVGTLSALPFLISPTFPLRIKWLLALGSLILLLLGAFIFTLPIGRIDPGRDDRQSRFDERDVVFARARLIPGSKPFKAYYDRRPQKKAVDERMRTLPGLLSSTSRKHQPLFFAAAEAGFDFTEAVREAVNGPRIGVHTQLPPDHFSVFVKDLTRRLGATSVGITRLNPNHVYSHVGRGTGAYGAPIALEHSYAIAFSVEMDRTLLEHAPEAPVILESARRYADAAVIAITLANFCRRLGYPSRAHIDGNYRVIAPLVGRDAGLGEIGRMGILMTPGLGPRVRLGVVTTDLPMLPDRRIDGGPIIDFCTVCYKCARNCPSQAIPRGDRQQDEQGLRWKLDEDRCFHYWNVIGTDCGVCMAVCPFSHPDNWAHNLMRGAVRRSGAARRAAVWLDAVLYGEALPRRPKLPGFSPRPL
jgi:reductive dehalogenase